MVPLIRRSARLELAIKILPEKCRSSSLATLDSEALSRTNMPLRQASVAAAALDVTLPIAPVLL